MDKRAIDTVVVKPEELIETIKKYLELGYLMDMDTEEFSDNRNGGYHGSYIRHKLTIFKK